uniref:Fcf2 pre-rRNA processing C-terminal domain-containing protein n=1 Tax=Timspurckia oligopyrenoides TaxID=708627 RepID=A0A7S1ESA5_9RHOD
MDLNADLIVVPSYEEAEGLKSIADQDVDIDKDNVFQRKNVSRSKKSKKLKDNSNPEMSGNLPTRFHNKTAVIDSPFVLPTTRNIFQQEPKFPPIDAFHIPERIDVNYNNESNNQRFEDIFQEMENSRNQNISPLEQKIKVIQKNDQSKWWILPQVDPSDLDLKRDIDVLRQREFLGGNRFYKSMNGSHAKGSKKWNPKRVQVGNVIESKHEFYSSRLPKKQRTQHFIQDLVNDTDFQSYAQNKIASSIKINSASSKRYKPRKSFGKK